jgi:hypothetical protein
MIEIRLLGQSLLKARAASCSRQVQKTVAAASRDLSEFFCHWKQGGKQVIDIYVLFLTTIPSF